MSVPLHKCTTPKRDQHFGPAAKAGETGWGYGSAFTDCREREDGTLWIDNGEYGSPVNFCPVCGYEAKVQSIPKPEPA